MIEMPCFFFLPNCRKTYQHFYEKQRYNLEWPNSGINKMKCKEYCGMLGRCCCHGENILVYFRDSSLITKGASTLAASVRETNIHFLHRCAIVMGQFRFLESIVSLVELELEPNTNTLAGMGIGIRSTTCA